MIKMLPKFEALKPLDGFDAGVTPCWQMIGLGNRKSVRLLNGSNAAIASRNPAIAEVVENAAESINSPHRIITIEGRAKGRTFIDVSENRIVKTVLEVNVKSRRSIRISFHFVHDNAGNGTIHNASELQGWLDIINNQIFLPQANVFVVQGIVNDPLKINQNLGSVIRDTSDFPDIPKKEHEVDLIMAMGDKTADINVFFVTDIEMDRNPNKNQIGGRQYDKGIFVDDVFKNPMASFPAVIAHEITHYLGVGGDNHYFKLKNIDGLMYYKARGGMRISKVHANMINR